LSGLRSVIGATPVLLCCLTFPLPRNGDVVPARSENDALILNLNDLPSLLRNDGGNAQNWIKLKLIGTKCNRTAIGARVRVVTGTHAQTDEVHSGASVMSQSDLRLYFGLGRFQAADLVEVIWPTIQKIERFTGLKAKPDPYHPRRQRNCRLFQAEDKVTRRNQCDQPPA
jgi:hypothetical protein